MLSSVKRYTLLHSVPKEGSLWEGRSPWNVIRGTKTWRLARTVQSGPSSQVGCVPVGSEGWSNGSPKVEGGGL